MVGKQSSLKHLCSIIDNKLLKFSINNLDDLKKSTENDWSEICADPLENFFSFSCQSEFNMELISKAFHVTMSDLFKNLFLIFLEILGWQKIFFFRFFSKFPRIVEKALEVSTLKVYREGSSIFRTKS